MTFSHPWSHVVIGMWHKYPNPHCTHVVTVDVLDRTVDPETGIIRTERVLGCKQKAPSWIVKVSRSQLSARDIISQSPFSIFLALWRLRRCLCPRNILYRPCNANRHDNVCQSVAVPVRLLLRANTVQADVLHTDVFCADSGDTGTDSHVEEYGRQV